MMAKRISRGLTLVEVLVVIFIIMVLMAITIPAVISSREAGRRASCLNNLHQIGIGIHGYATAYGVFPAARNGLDYSPQVQILPYNGQTALYDVFDKSVPEAVQAQHPGKFPSIRRPAKVPTLLCPSDPYAWSVVGEVTSYAGNEGDGTTRRGSTNGFFSDGPYPRLENHLSPAEFTDGLSHTVAFSEWLVGQGWLLGAMGSPGTPGSGNSAVTAGPRERLSYRLAEGVWGPPLTNAEFIDRCRALRGMEPDQGIQKGMMWFMPGVSRSLYNHGMSINDNSCRNSFNTTTNFLLSITASSLHGSGVNVLMGDGHARFVPQSIGLPVWRAMSTRSGNEVD